MSENPSPPARGWAAVLREPLVWFAVLGTALGAAWIEILDERRLL